MRVSNYKATFSPIDLVFLELDTHRPHLDFKILDEKNNEVILRKFYLQLLNKEWAYTTMKQGKFSQMFNSTVWQEPQAAYLLNKLSEIRAFFLNEIEERRRYAKKKKNDSSKSQISLTQV